MKKILLHVYAAVLILCIQACCTKKECTNYYDLTTIELYDFPINELDSILITRYLKANNFQTPIDSQYVNASTSTLDASATFTYQLKNTHDYQIKFRHTTNVYMLTQLVIDKRSCNECIPFRRSKDYFEVLVGYTLNGEKHTGNHIKIYK